MLYEDAGQIESLLPIDAAPAIEVTDEQNVLHRVWPITDPQPDRVLASQTAMS